MRVTRRDLLTAAGGAAALAAASRVLRAAVSAQAPQSTIAPGTEKLARLIRHSSRPPDYETPVALLDSWLTPADNLYVRSHLPMPTALNAASWRLHIDGEVSSPAALSLDDIRRMPATTLTATLECAGNGRGFFDPPVAGVQWRRGAVGTVRWTGVRMADLLKRAGLESSGRFVVMDGADLPPGTMPDFVRQIPMDKAMDPGTIVAYEMNGSPIPALHGYPLRAIVPGWEGAYWMKWLSSLRVLDREFDGFWVSTGYRYPVKRVAPGSTVAPADMAPLTGLAVKSLITQPLEGSTHAPGTIAIAGFAWAGENDIARVDVSTDQGTSWQPASLTGEQAQYTWRRFELSFQAARPESYLIMSRATDTRGRRQPIVPPWNPSGYLWNAPDSVRIEVK